jgi:peptide/nickel transport system substrate-binding protein
MGGRGFEARKLAAAAVALSALFASCSSGEPRPVGPPGGSGGGGTVRGLLTQDPPSMSLVGKADRYSEIVATQITDSLVQYDPRMELQPRVAESWEFSDDRLVLTFRLREGVRWHDGREVTADDVVFSVGLVRDPAVENRTFSSLFQDLESVEALDRRTVRARYRTATPEALEAWQVPLLPRHLAEEGAALITGAYAEHPVGCGPFRFVRYRPGEEIVLEANDDYWDGRPRIDRLVLRIILDQRTGFQALLRGDLDIIVVTPDLWNEARRSDAAARLASFSYYRLNVWQVGWNLDGSNPFFTDPRVRRAMLLALDRQRFIGSVVDGQALVAATTYHPDLPLTDPAVRPLPYDPQEAGRLLDEAGWRDTDGDGVREREGRPFEFTLMMFTSSQALNDHMAAWQQQSWAEIGVRAEIEKLDWHHFREKREAHDFEAAMAGLGFTPNPDQYELYHTSAADAGYNYGSFSDAEVDRLLERGRREWDPEERRRIYSRLQHRLNELQPVACLLHLATPVLHDRRLRGVVASPLDHWRTTEGPRVWHWAADGE